MRQYCYLQPLFLFTENTKCYFHELDQFPGLQIVLFYFCFPLSVALYMCKSLMCLTPGFNSAGRRSALQFSVEQNVRGLNPTFQWYFPQLVLNMGRELIPRSVK